MIPKSENAKPLVAQPCIPFGVIVNLFRVLAAVNLNNNPLRQTDKVDDVNSYGLLPAKLESVNLPHSDPTLEQPFGVGGIMAQRASI